MKKIFTFIIAIALSFSLLSATGQTLPVKQWDARFGGNDLDYLSAVHQTSDGGYILGGESFSGITGDKTQESRGGADYWIVKTDANGVKQWDARFGGSDDDGGVSLQQTSDGGYIIGGTSISGISGDKTQASQGNWDYWIVKMDASGVKQWDARFGGSDDDALSCLQQTSDGGYILGGSSESGISGDKTQASQGEYDYWIVKTDANGVKQWDVRFGGSNWDYFYSLQQTSDGGYILGGGSQSGFSGDKTQASQGLYDYWIVKTDSDGVKQWDKRFGGSHYDDLFSLQQTSDGGYILGGESYSGISGDKTQASQGLFDYWIVKTDSNGVKQWDKRFGGSDNDELYIHSLKQTSDGGYILGGLSDSGISGDKTQASQGLFDYWIVKTDSDGVKQWDARFGGNDLDYLNSLQQTSDNGYILGGVSQSGISGDKTQTSQGYWDYWLVKLVFVASDSSVCEKFCINFSDPSTNNPTAWHWIFQGGSPSSSTDQDPINICYNNPGTYNVGLITTNANGFDTLVLPDFIHVYSTPPVPSITQAGYSLTSSVADFYQWQFNTVDIPGATNQSYEVMQTGYYTVVTSNVNGCVSSTTLYVEITGIENIFSEQSIFISPNPTDGKFLLELKLSDVITAEATIEVINLLGQIILSENTSLTEGKLQKEIRLSDVAHGMYLVKVTINDQVFTSQIDLQK